MFCTNCGAEITEGTLFCTNCGTSLASSAAATTAAGSGAYDQTLGASLEAAVQANRDTIDSIEARAQAQVDAAFQDFPPIEAAEPQPGEPYGANQTPAGSPEQTAQAVQAQRSPEAVPVPAPVPIYQRDASPNAHYSSQRSYGDSAYGQYAGQPGYQQGQPYQQPSFNQPGAQASAQAQQTWYPQSATHRAYAMVLYMAGLIGIIIALCVRDKNDAFITHHLNAALVIFIGGIVGGMLSIIGIGLLILLYLFVMTILGMVNAYNGETKELPLIGKIHIIS